MDGPVVIDSQPLTVVVLASLLYGESIGLVGIAGLILGVVGLALLEFLITVDMISSLIKATPVAHKKLQHAHMFLKDEHICSNKFDEKAQRTHMFLEDGHICRWLNPMKDDVRS
ncbi:hypothetical protein Tco_0093457 [Tanacetum coccineum]